MSNANTTTHFALRVPLSIMAQAKRAAEQDGVSLNQFISTALSEKVSALCAESVLAMRANRANRKKFDKVMSKAGRRNAPREDDRI